MGKGNKKEPFETARHLNPPFRVCFWAEYTIGSNLL